MHTYRFTFVFDSVAESEWEGEDQARSEIESGRLVPTVTVDEDRCPHLSWTGDEGPVALLGRMPLRWKCDECGLIRHDTTSKARRRAARRAS